MYPSLNWNFVFTWHTISHFSFNSSYFHNHGFKVISNLPTIILQTEDFVSIFTIVNISHVKHYELDQEFQDSGQVLRL